MSLVDEYQYVTAWSIYGVAGIGACLFWWRLTSPVNHHGWRDLLRGIVVVLIYTPWSVGEPSGFYAPAIIVLLMDLLIEGSKSGLEGGIALLLATFFMLIVLTIKQFRRNRLRDI